MKKIYSEEEIQELKKRWWVDNKSLTLSEREYLVDLMVRELCDHLIKEGRK
jgi:hypothetical protein